MVQTLDVHAEIHTQYCIELWRRDEQVKLAIARVKDRICGPIAPETRGDIPIAVVCYGPSLIETWETVRDFDYVISCSGSHKFLVERGIVPTWHVEVDPRAHKTQLIGQPHPQVEYLIASTCHQQVFDRLDGFTVKLWHVFATEEEAFRTLPRGEWALTGGSSVGLRAMAIARHLGFRNQHVFGMDGNRRDDEQMHAAAHPSQPKGYALVEYGGRTWKTTPSLLACAKGTFHELNQMYDVRATFHGDGLVQAMAKDYVPQPVAKEKAILGFKKPELISPEYATLNAQLHRENLAYGVGGGKHASVVLKLAEGLRTQSILDYGAGKGYLAKALPFPIWEYDPAIPEKRESPRPADLVVCTDVLEHIEPDKLPYVLDDLRRCVKKVGFFTIHTGPAQKTLADGRNAHLIQKGKTWWTKQLERFFTVGSITQKGVELIVVVGPKAVKKGRAA